MNKLVSVLCRPYILLRDKYVEILMGRLSEADRFSLIYKLGYWKGVGKGSLSGAGSNYDSTENIRQSLPSFVQKYNVNSILDIPCGDFYWMKDVDLSNANYFGGDIVKEIVLKNSDNFGGAKRHFYGLDIINDQLMQADLVFVRDCFVHLTDEQVLKSLRNIVSSGATYLMTTTFPNVETNNVSDLKDRWRPINLQLAPFNLPSPMLLIDDSWNDNYFDANKKMGVWSVADLSCFFDEKVA